MLFENELERKVNKKSMGGSLGKFNAFRFLSAQLQKGERGSERKSRVMERKKHDKRKRLDIHSKKKQKNRKSDTERWYMNYQSQRIRCSVYSN